MLYFRFIAGFGLAGELGAGITLVTEILPKRETWLWNNPGSYCRHYGCFARIPYFSFFDWRTAYFIGGGLGLILMVLRVRVFESGMFMKLKEKNIKRGDVT
jgi:hypothetical protein